MRKFLFLLFFTALVQSMMAQDGGVISGKFETYIAGSILGT